MRIRWAMAFLMLSTMGCDDGDGEGVLGFVSETRCEKASRLHIEAQCTPPLGHDQIIDTACEGINVSRCGGAGGDLVTSMNAISGGAISAVIDLCEFTDDGELNPAADECRICIEKRCGHTRAECIKDLMGTSYGTLVYECETVN